jgi:hypothetical protein
MGAGNKYARSSNLGPAEPFDDELISCILRGGGATTINWGKNRGHLLIHALLETASRKGFDVHPGGEDASIL